MKDIHAISVSGGKDSTALMLLMIERGLPIDAVLYADTGMDYEKKTFMQSLMWISLKLSGFLWPSSDNIYFGVV